jgi:hypothetical protein
VRTRSLICSKNLYIELNRTTRWKELRGNRLVYFLKNNRNQRFRQYRVNLTKNHQSNSQNLNSHQLSNREMLYPLLRMTKMEISSQVLVEGINSKTYRKRLMQCLMIWISTMILKIIACKKRVILTIALRESRSLRMRPQQI